MKTLLKSVSYLGLGLTVAPAFLVFSGSLTWDNHATLMAVGAVLWFATAPFWMVEDDESHPAGESASETQDA